MNWSSKHQRIIVDTAERQIVPIPRLAFGFPYPDGSEKCIGGHSGCFGKHGC